MTTSNPGLLALLLASLLLFGCPEDSDQDDDIVGDDDDTYAHCEGNYVIDSEADLEAIALCESIAGDLTLDDQDWLTSIDLPNLESVDGDLWIEKNDALTSLDMPCLSTVGGYLVPDPKWSFAPPPPPILLARTTAHAGIKSTSV